MPGVLNGLGQVYLSKRNYGLAETYLLKAAPQAPAAYFGLAAFNAGASKGMPSEAGVSQFEHAH